jgi:hypothetical protein
VASVTLTEGSLLINDLRYDEELRYRDVVGCPGAFIISEVARANTSLTSLDVRYNSGIVGEAAERLATSVLESKSMKIFGLIPMKGLRANEVTELDLRGKGLGPVEAHVIGSLVAVSTSLTVIDLRFNQLDNESATMLATIAKEKNISLCGITPEQTTADLHGRPTNMMGSADAILLTADLAVRASLTTVWTPAYEPSLDTP